MDRKGIIGLLICGLLLAVHFYYSTKNEAWRQQQAKQVQEEEAAKEVVEVEAGEGEVAMEGQDGESGGDVTTEVVPEREIILETDEVVFVLTTKGGGVKSAEFKNQLAVGSETEKVKLNRFGETAVGSLVEGGVDSLFDLDYKVLSESATEVGFGARTPEGLLVTKRWSVSEGKREVDQYVLNLVLEIKNGQEAGSVDLRGYGLSAGAAGPLVMNEEVRGTGFFAYDGGLFFKDSNYFGKGMFRGPRSNFEEEKSGVEFAGVSNQFFATMLSTKEGYDATIWARAKMVELEEASGGGERRAVRLAWSLPPETLRPGTSEAFEYELFMGPKNNRVVRQLGSGRGDVMHYGFFSFISQPLNLLLNFYHDSIFDKIARNWSWGLSIILLTFTIRILIWPLHNASTRTMKRMSKLQPLMQEIKEKYPDDQQKQQTETMKLYKQYEINPVGGCLPMFAQIPIFFGFYSMLRSAVELRGQGFMWVDDLSMPDTVAEVPLPFSLPFIGDILPINLLPILMMVTMFLQMKMTPQVGDPLQRRIFMLMPFMFFFFCYNFASALALYWTAQNIFSIGQTWIMQKLPEPELKKRKEGKKSFMEKMAEKAEEAQRMQKEGKRPGMGGGEAPKKLKKPRGPKTGG